MRWADWRKRIAALLHREQLDQDIEEELEFHIAMEARKHATHGASRHEAARLASLGLGSVERVKEECRSVRGLDMLETTIRTSPRRCAAFDGARFGTIEPPRP